VRSSKCIFAPKKVAFSLGKWVSEVRQPSFKKKKKQKTKKNKNKNPLQAQKAKMSILCWFYKYFLNGMQQLLAAKNRAKSKTSKKWKNLIFAHADFDHTSNEIRRGRKFQVQK